MAIVGPRPAAERARGLLDSRAAARGIELVTAEASDVSTIVESEVALFLALSDPTQIERGALLSLSGAVDEPTWLRRLALRIDDLQAGRRVEALDAWPIQGREWLNLATARRLGWAPDFDLLTQARLIDAVADEPFGIGTGTDAVAGALSLEQAVALTLSDNLELEIARHETESQALDRDEALSRWRPNLYLEATGRQIDDNRAVSALGQSPERRATAGVTLEQLIFSEPALAAVAVTASLNRAQLGLALNRRLGLPGDAELVPQAPDVSSPEWLAGDARFAEWVRSPESLGRWQAALVDDALRSSRELQALAAGREAANRELEARRRAFWVPEVGLQVRYDRELYRAGAGDRAPWESDSSVVQSGVAALEGLGVRLPETG